jgi:putative tryptophan/tyrosine transport system substrate-binding protein
LLTRIGHLAGWTRAKNRLRSVESIGGLAMKRREFISLIGIAAGWPFVTHAQVQRKERPRRIGILMPLPQSDAASQTRIQLFRQELLRLGWSNGGNVQFDERWSTDDMEKVRADAGSLVELNPGVILTFADRVIPVLMKLTSSIPIVVVATSDPIASGAAESLARPGHNVTGFSLIEFSMFGKMLEILKLMAPGISRVGMLCNPDNPVGVTYLSWFEPSARQLGLQPINLAVHDVAAIESAIAGMAERPNGGILAPPDLTTLIHRTQLIDLAARSGVPAIYAAPLFAEAGGLVSYGPDVLEMFRRAAGYVDRILRGEKPGDLPFQQPTHYRLLINLKTAKELGLTVAATLLAQADEAIE